MITVKVTFKNGDHLTTGINATLDDAKRYYIGNTFNLGVDDDLLTKAVSVEEV